MPRDDAASAQVSVELVIRTATSLLVRRLAPREAVTILATQAPHARALAPSLRELDADRAAAYRTLLTSLAAGIREALAASDDPRDCQAVVDDLERLVAALDG